MRKWMRDRLKRPKKNAEASKNEPAQAPLQPAYYDAPMPLRRRLQPMSPNPEMESQPAPETPPIREEVRGCAPVSTAALGRKRRPAPPTAAGKRRTRPRRSAGGKELPVTDVPRAEATENGQPGVAPAIETAGAAKATPAAAPRASKGTVVLAIGLPGSGKSSWFKRHNITPLSSDMLRALLFDDPTEQRFQDLIFSNLRSMLKARLIARRPMNYVDATNLTPHERQSWIKLGQDYGYEVQAVFFDVPTGSLSGAQSQART